jgi:hypothetical protein
VLRFSFLAPDRGQKVQVVINGSIVTRFGDAAPIEATWISDEIPFEGKEGANSLEFRCSDWNGREGAWFAPNDPRPMSIRFQRLLVE